MKNSKRCNLELMLGLIDITAFLLYSRMALVQPEDNYWIFIFYYETASYVLIGLTLFNIALFFIWFWIALKRPRSAEMMAIVIAILFVLNPCACAWNLFALIEPYEQVEGFFTNGRMYHLTARQYENGTGGLTLFQCDRFGIQCHQIYDSYSSVSVHARGSLSYNSSTNQLFVRSGERVIYTYQP
jgi:hypothetical protein